MALSRELAGLVGPALVAISVTEAMNMGIFVAQTAPVVYLNGTLLFVAGLAILRAHNRWSWTWTVLITLTGAAALILGLLRMVFPGAPQADTGLATYLMLAVIFAAGAVLSYVGYAPKRQEDGTR